MKQIFRLNSVKNCVLTVLFSYVCKLSLPSLVVFFLFIIIQILVFLYIVIIYLLSFNVLNNYNTNKNLLRNPDPDTYTVIFIVGTGYRYGLEKVEMSKKNIARE